MANANACLQKRGAKNGLLKKGAKFKNVKIKKKWEVIRWINSKNFAAGEAELLK